MTSILIFLAVIGVLIVIHELGHFAVAKAFGVTVERFSIGFGPVLLKKTLFNTEFCVSAVPLGGYVKLAGEDPKESKGDGGEYCLKPAYQKFLIVLAGPIMNALLAFFLFTSIHFMGYTQSSLVGSVLEDSPAQKAGLIKGDRIVRIDENQILYWEELLEAVAESEGREISVEIDRDGVTKTLDITPRLEEGADVFGDKKTVPFIGVGAEPEMLKRETSLGESIVYGAQTVYVTSKLILKSLLYVSTGRISFKKSFTGPVGIYVLIGQAAEIGFLVLLQLVSVISICLFVINLLPIPVLDGGHLLFIAIEGLLRRPINEKIKDRLSQAGLIFFIGLFVFVMYYDAIKYGAVDRIREWIGM